jgi:RNA polymerase sigma factor (sigma-70 family)
MTTTVKRIQDGCDGADLVARCRRGDADAWPDFVRRFAPYVHAIAVRGYRLSEQDGEDVFQEVFLRAWTHIDSLRDDAAIRPWLGQLTRRLCIDRLRAAHPSEPLEEEPAAVDERLEQIEQAVTVNAALAGLSEDCREILDRFFARDESYRTIGEALDLPAGTIASRISRCLGRLRSALEGRSPGS